MTSLFELITWNLNQNKFLDLVTRDFYLDLNFRGVTRNFDLDLISRVSNSRFLS